VLLLVDIIGSAHKDAAERMAALAPATIRLAGRHIVVTKPAHNMLVARLGSSGGCRHHGCLTFCGALLL
jgi:hypothetical protein